MTPLIIIVLIVLILLAVYFIPFNEIKPVIGGTGRSPRVIELDNIYLITKKSCPACVTQKEQVVAKNTITGISFEDIYDQMEKAKLNPDDYDISKVPVWLNTNNGTSLVGIKTYDAIMKFGSTKEH
jgi:hypothetical protein